MLRVCRTTDNGDCTPSTEVRAMAPPTPAATPAGWREGAAASATGAGARAAARTSDRDAGCLPASISCGAPWGSKGCFPAHSQNTRGGRSRPRHARQPTTTPARDTGRSRSLAGTAGGHARGCPAGRLLSRLEKRQKFFRGVEQLHRLRRAARFPLENPVVMGPCLSITKAGPAPGSSKLTCQSRAATAPVVGDIDRTVVTWKISPVASS